MQKSRQDDTEAVICQRQQLSAAVIAINATITTNTKSVTLASDTEPSVAIIDDLKYLCMAGPESLEILCRNVWICADVCVCVKALDICN